MCDTPTIFHKTLYATHPDMMTGALNQDLRDQYLMSGLFSAEAVTLNYTHLSALLLAGRPLLKPQYACLTRPNRPPPPVIRF